MSIFRDYAEHYWNAGLPVIPLAVRDKLPVIKGWQRFQSMMPEHSERESWLYDFPNGNIGLPMGPESGLIALDIDTDDPQVLAIIEKVFPPSPWQRVGAKGKVMVYKYDGQPNFRIRTREGASLVEMLGAGCQIVLPPSIHPKTDKPYWCNRDLVEVLGEVRSLPANIADIFKDALREVGIETNAAGLGALTEFVSTGSRDNRMVATAGLFANDILRGHMTLMEALERIRVWTTEFTAKVYGDTMDPEKGVQKVIEFLVRDVTGPKQRVLPKGWDEGLSDAQRNQLGLGIFTEDHERWSYQQIIDHFNAQLERNGVAENDDQFITLIQATASKIAANRDISNVEEDRLIRYMADVSGKRITVSALRREITQLRTGAIKGTDHKDIAEAVINDLVTLGGEIRCVDGQLWQWTGACWERMREASVMKHIATEYGSYAAARKASDHSGVFRTVKNLAQATDLCQIDVKGINFVNGFLTEDLELKPHHPDFGMTYVLPYPYKPELAGKCGKWLAMLSDYWGEDEDYAEKVESLREAIAATLFTKAPGLAMAFCLFGVAGSGKSRILEVVRSLMPSEAVTAIPPNEWGDKFAPAQLQHKLLNVAGELSESHFIDSQRFKVIVEGGLITAQHKNMPTFAFEPQCAHWFASNHPPKTRDSSDGFTRRWLFLHFSRRLPIEKRQENYDQIVVAEEREAIVAWAVQGILSLKRNNGRITEPKSCLEIRERLESALNTVRSFIVDLQEAGRILVGEASHSDSAQKFTTQDTLWTEYRSYCLQNSVVPVGSKTLVTRMADLADLFGYRVVKAPNQNGIQVTQYHFITFRSAAKAR